ncbi:MAG: NAD(P)H-hydrate dehydratase [Acidobacteria bacterium]|nr:MAG: NAD(P)H-hydrate dehydratase [Acidobacteriota bacterium]
MKTSTRPTVITPNVLRRMPLPLPEEGGDKEERGRVLVVGGSRETPGAVVLAGTAALRAGAGKLQLATVATNAPLVAASVPESRVFALPETKTGKLAKAACARLEEQIGEAQTVCIGPGMIEDESVVRFVVEALRLCECVPVLLDAGAIACLGGSVKLLHTLGGRAVVTPNAEELADIYGEEKEKIKRAPLESARRAARDFRAVVVLKGRETFVASPAGEVYVNRAGGVGLATSGAGDVLAGVIAGLFARGAEPLRAAAWGVYVHALAGERLTKRLGPLGFLARELLAEIPPVLSELSGGHRSRTAAGGHAGESD